MSVMLSGRIKTRPRPLSEIFDFRCETEEILGSVAEELHEKKVVERVLGVLGRAHQSQQPVVLCMVRAGKLAVKEL
jgi:hypothetical protein